MNLLKSYTLFGLIALVIGTTSCDKKEEETTPVTPTHIGVSARIGNIDWKSVTASARVDSGFLVIKAATETEHLTMSVAGTNTGNYKVNSSSESRVMFIDSSYSSIEVYSSEINDTLKGYINITRIDDVNKTISGNFYLYTINDNSGEILVMENGIINQVSYSDTLSNDTVGVDGALFTGSLETTTITDTGSFTNSVPVTDENGTTIKQGTRFITEYQLTVDMMLRMSVEQTVQSGTLITPGPANNSVVSFHLIKNGIEIYSMKDSPGNSFIVDERNEGTREISGSVTLFFEGPDEANKQITYRVKGAYEFTMPE